MDLSRKLGAGSKDSVVSRAADKLSQHPHSPERLPKRIEYTRTPDVQVPADVLERHRIAVATNNTKAADAFRLLRTQLLMQMSRNGWQTLAVTSPNQGAGKSTVALNLAISFGMEVDYTALLVDADLRAPYLRTMLDLEPGPGLGDYLIGKASLEDMLIHPNLGNLVVLPGGEPIEYTAELMGSPMMIDMVRELRNRYPNRLIVFDVPPNLSSADTLALSSYIDATILLVEEDRTTPDEVQRACDLLRHANLLGVVLNKSRELPDPGPTRRRRPGFFSRFFLAQKRRTTFAPARIGNRETAAPGPPPSHRNELPQQSESSTTVPGGLSDSSRERDPIPLAIAPKMSEDTDERLTFTDEADLEAAKTAHSATSVGPPGPRPSEDGAQHQPAGKRSHNPNGLARRLVSIFLVIAFIVGGTGVFLAKTGRFDAFGFLHNWLGPILGSQSAGQQNELQELGRGKGKPSSEIEIDRNNPTPSESGSARGPTGQPPDLQGQEIGRLVRDGASPVELGSETPPKGALTGAVLPSTSTPTVTSKEAEPHPEPKAESETSGSADSPQLNVAKESAFVSGDPNEITGPPLETQSVEPTGDTDEGGGLNPEPSPAAEPVGNQAVLVEMDTAAGSDEAIEGAVAAAEPEPLERADESPASQTAPGEMGTVVVSDEAVEYGAEDAAKAYSVTWDTTTVPDGTYTLTAVARDAAGNTTTSAPRTVTVANAPLPDTSAPERGEGVEGAVVALERESAVQVDEPTVSQAIPTEMEAAAGSDDTVEDSVVTAEEDSASQADKMQKRLDRPSAGKPASEVSYAPASNLQSSSAAKATHEVTVPLNAKVDPPGLRDQPQGGPEPQPVEPKLLAVDETPKPSQTAETTQPHPDLDRLIARGDELLALGDVASARLFYRMAANKGSARGAAAIGWTYDPVYMERTGVAGPSPSPAEAIKWYRQALEMGHRGADLRMQELTDRLKRAAALGDREAQRILHDIHN